MNRRGCLAGAGAAVLSTALASCDGPAIRFHYILSMTVRDGKEIKTGYAVQSYWGAHVSPRLISVLDYNRHMRGDAPFVKLRSGRYLIATNARDNGGAWDARYILSELLVGHNSFGDEVDHSRPPPPLPEPLVLPPEYWPVFVTFRDNNDAATLQMADDKGVGDVVGRDVSVQHMTLAYTHEPVTYFLSKEDQGFLKDPSRFPNFIPGEAATIRLGSLIDLEEMERNENRHR